MLARKDRQHLAAQAAAQEAAREAARQEKESQQNTPTYAPGTRPAAHLQRFQKNFGAQRQEKDVIATI